ncbi:CDP-diacylglycerol--serine O-phosphatidyltransferase [Aridibaculum aurantiacum]|uniref:CDP-diacylglycerol--serine O-phosphatidyltransferase n=1 Tax=Aridibaculum aurantiacum TaxID=2810307 RepID=UPI001A96A3F7|nr:CDP-diacylglycerol--serine O-phosphatidyltransferase [Aridibaculum aurantiacum]
MKQIPNIFTLLNLFFGCLAIVFILQNGMVATSNEGGDLILMLPERIYWASAFIGIAAVIDFLDGFVARLLKASSEMGKQLDSLADVVSFGVAPAMIVYQFLRLSFAQQPDGLEISAAWLLPAFIIPCAGAYRLARFNIDTEQSERFKGVPIPAVGLLTASFPLIYWYSGSETAITVLLNQWFWFAYIAIVSWLMVSTLPMMALKFKDYSFINNMSKYLLILAAIACAIFLQWMAVPLVFAIYVILSLATKAPPRDVVVPHDVTK